MSGYDISCLRPPARIYSTQYIGFRSLTSTLTITLNNIIREINNNNLHLPLTLMSDRKNKDSSHKNMIHQVINLEDSTACIPTSEQELFVADLASQCNILLNWVGNPGSEYLAEVLWKNKMRIRACERFPDFDADQIRKLVDRDWRIMNQNNKKTIVQNFSTQLDAQILQSRAQALKSRIQDLKSTLS